MINTYWDDRFRKEGYVWGTQPSRTVKIAAELFRKNNVTTILVPGAGYGRNTSFLSNAGFRVTGIEISAYACELAKAFDPRTIIYCRSALDLSFLRDVYDAIYCFNVLHLFVEDDRRRFLNESSCKVKTGGLLYFTVFSEKEEAFGKGREVEKNTFETRPGRPAHYFTEDDLLEHFSNFTVLESGITEDAENHGEGPHTHKLRYIVAKKN